MRTMQIRRYLFYSKSARNKERTFGRMKDLKDIVKRYLASVDRYNEAYDQSKGKERDAYLAQVRDGLKELREAIK